MALKDIWRPRVDNVDDADSSAVNEIADAVIELEENELSSEQLENIDKIPSIEQTIIGVDVTAQNAYSTASSAYERTEALESSKQDKVTIYQESGLIGYDFKFDDMYNCEYQIKSDLANVSFTFGTDAYPNDYIAGLSFDSGDAPTTVSYIGTGILNWVGTDCTTSEGYSIFQPSANTHYDIVFYFNGTQMIGLVNGFVPASGNVVSE